jgi:quercetin dioxygenase-like cupin family protein
MTTHSARRTYDSTIVHLPGEGKTSSLTGVTFTFKAVTADTNGAYTLFEVTAPPHFAGPPPHWHTRMQESFYVLEGRLVIRLGERVISATPGAFIQVPRNAMHSFANEDATPARFLTLVTPGGFEGYWEELETLVRAAPNWPPADLAEVEALNLKYDIHR